jgi:prevent-host-death family protein
MVREVTATEAKAKLLALLDEVENGEEVLITRHGRRVARLEPATGGMALWGLHEGMVTIHATDEELISGVEWDQDEWLKKWDDL